MRCLPDDKVTLIAEAGVNHDGDLDKALKLIDAAAAAGADMVKFQMFRADGLAAPNAPKADYQARALGQAARGQQEMLRDLELSPDAFHRIVEHCADAGIGFLCSPFDPESLRTLIEEFRQTLLKFGSGELTNAPLLHAAAQRGCDLILSTGMADLAEVDTALAVLAHGYGGGGAPGAEAFAAALADPILRQRVVDKTALLHCTSQYPTPAEDVNLRAMEMLAQTFGIQSGYSDHTLGDLVPVAAVAMGATIIEKHLTLDCTAPGPDHAASMEPNDFAAMTARIRELEAALGDGVKTPRAIEADVAAVARKSLVARVDIAAGAPFSADNLSVKRPAGGLSPNTYWALLGRPANRAYAADEPIDPDAL